MAFVMASQAQREATEMDEAELAMAEEMMDFGAEKVAEDTPSFENSDSG